MKEEIERLDDNDNLSAILSLSHPLLIPYEAQGYVFVWAECGECCGWRPMLISSLKKGDDAYNLAGKFVVSMAVDFEAT